MNKKWTQYRKLLIQYLGPYWLLMLALSVLLFSNIGLQLYGPQVIRTFIDAATTGATVRELLIIAALFMGVTLLQQAVSIGATYVGNNVGWQATNDLRTNLFNHCLKLDMPFHQRHTPGAMIERIDGDVSVLSNFFSNFILLFVGNLFLVCGVLGLLYREDWRLGLLFTVFALVTLYGFRLVEGKVSPYWEKAQEASAELYSFIEERLAGLDDIRANGAVPAMMRRFFQAQRSFFRGNLHARFVTFVIGSTTSILIVGGTVAALGLGIYLFELGILTLGGVYLITHYSSLIERPLDTLGDQVDDLQRVGASVARINELLQQESVLVDGAKDASPRGINGQNLDKQAATIEFDHVTFQYENSDKVHKSNENGTLKSVGDEIVLSDLTFSLSPGQVLGLLGRTGSGKTTLTRLLFRLYDPTKGEIRFNGTPLTDISITDLRMKIGLVTQDVQLFDGTLRDNLTFFDERVSDSVLIEAFHNLGLEAWLNRLSDGLDTRLGAGGQGFSAGEAQLIALARVFLNDASLVILDEASSRLDPATERLIEGAINRLLANRTGLIIAHRLSTVQRVDEIMILEQGRIREYGKRQELANDTNTVYAQLLQTAQETNDLQEVLA
ncbi:ABC transporter ATP-binding protein/permease [Chloroflexi bacterium TSY]|nr:ABC transporter ATP-binding protein/permease [Chloroflexi bacterium TSY]